MNNGVYWDVTPYGFCDVSEELSASIIRVTRIGELGTALAVTLYFFAACVKYQIL
jgi:hypothetical protein